MPDEQKYTLRQAGSVIQQLLDSIQSQAYDISGKADRTYVDSALSGKVDKETGKGLSSNDYTTADRQKLAGIAANAQANVPSDWNATVGDARILNKPDLSVYPTRTEMNQAIAGVSVDLSAYSTTAQMNAAIATSAAAKVDKITGKGLSTNDFTDAERTKLGGIETGAQVNVPSDWIATSGAAMILNKPDLDIYPSRTEMQAAIAQATPDLSIYATTAQVESMIGRAGTLEYVPASTLPTASASTMGKVFLVPSGSGNNRIQWMTVEEYSSYSWVQIGTTEIDLSGFVELGEVVESNVPLNA